MPKKKKDNGQIEIPAAWLGVSEFYMSLPPTEKTVYDRYFDSLKKGKRPTRKQLAKMADCAVTTVDSFFSRPETKEEAADICKIALSSADIVNIYSMALKMALTPKGHRERDLFLKTVGFGRKETEGSVSQTINLINDVIGDNSTDESKD